MSVFEALSKIQSELKAPKNLYNSFGKYKYRNAESILEAAKPLCAKYGCTLIVMDEIVLIGSRYYIKATAIVFDREGHSTSTTAFAREDETKKGMDGAQITGTASSYARKYALFLSTLSLRRATAKVHKTVGHFCAYETNFMEIASSC